MPNKKSSKSKRLMPGGFLTNPVYVQIIQPHIAWLLKQRDSATPLERTSINASIILFSAIFFEGFLEDILCSFIWSYYDLTNNAKSKVISELENISSLDSYTNAFEHVGVPLTNFLSQLDRENIKMIFDIRNLLAHGQRDSYIIMHEGDFRPKKISGGYYKKIDDFLVKRKIIKRATHPQGNQFDTIFSNDVADWTKKIVKELSVKILKNINFNLGIHRGSQEFRFKIIEMYVEKF